MKLRNVGPALLVAIVTGGCGTETIAPPSGIVMQAGQNVSGAGLRAVFGAGTYTPGEGEALVVTQAGCSGVVNRSFNVDFGGDDCLSMTTTAGVTLTDDAYFGLTVKNGKVIAVQFWIQDKSGPDGIGYESDKVTITPQAPVAGGFTLHVNRQLPVWRLGGHLARKRVAQVGTVSIGAIVYYQ